MHRFNPLAACPETARDFGNFTVQYARSMKKRYLFLGLSLLLVLVLSACSAPTALPTATALPSATPLPSATFTPEPSATPLPSATFTPEPTATATAIPFKGFLEYFRFYRAWYDGDTTVFYFLNAGLEYPLYASVEENTLFCDRDPELEVSMICTSEQGRIDYKKAQDFRFYSDPDHRNLVYEMRVEPPAGLVTRYSNTYDCPERGQNVYCEKEYRLYSNGYCSTSISCSDACGYWYSQDNLPSEPDAPWVPVGSCN